MPVLSPIGEAVHAALRKLDIAAQAVVLRVDATMLDFDVYAQLVSNDTDFLQRHHYLESVWFTDGPTGDDGFVIQGTFVLPAESVIFTDGTNGDNGLVIFLPISMGSEAVTFTEDAYSQAFAINNTEYVTFADYSVQYLLAFNRDEQVIFSDMSIAWASIYEWDESVLVSDSGHAWRQHGGAERVGHDLRGGAGRQLCHPRGCVGGLRVVVHDAGFPDHLRYRHVDRHACGLRGSRDRLPARRLHHPLGIVGPSVLNAGLPPPLPEGPPPCKTAP